MRYILTISMLSLMCGCHWLKSEKEAITPEEVAVAFSQALANLDMDKAAHYSDKETAKLIDNMRGLIGMVPYDKKQEAKEKAKFIQAATCTVTGNTAMCRICCDENGANSNEEVTLRLQDNGKWRVFIDKNAAQPVEEE